MTLCAIAIKSSKLSRITCLLLQICLCFSAGATLTAEAAEFLEPESPFSNCAIVLSGEIEKGDFDILKGSLEDSWGRLCLNSDGGDWQEAIKIAEWIRRNAIGTYVGSNKRCFSACALIFMAGTYQYSRRAGHSFQHHERTLHVSGKLGFHAPQLVAVDRPPKNTNELKDIYDRALTDVHELLALLTQIDFPIELSAEMFSRRNESDGYFEIDNTYKAALFSIDISGYTLPPFDEVGFANVCISLALEDFPTPEVIGAYGWDRVFEAEPTRIRSREDEVSVSDAGVYIDRTFLLEVPVISEQGISSVCRFSTSGISENSPLYGEAVDYREWHEWFDEMTPELEMPWIRLWKMHPPGTPFSHITVPSSESEVLGDPGAIRALQEALWIRFGYEIGPIDGVLGPRTSSAIDDLAMKLPKRYELPDMQGDTALVIWTAFNNPEIGMGGY